MSARNRFRGVVREVKVDGLLAQVEIASPSRRASSRSSRATQPRSSGSKPGMRAAAFVKATSVMVER